MAKVIDLDFSAFLLAFGIPAHPGVTFPAVSTR